MARAAIWLLLPEVAGGIAAPGSATRPKQKQKSELYDLYNGTSETEPQGSLYEGAGLGSPLAAAERSIATKSVKPYLPSKYRIMVVSSMT